MPSLDRLRSQYRLGSLPVMPFAFAIDAPHQLLYLRLWGHVDLNALLGVRHAVRQDQAFLASLDVLADVTHVDDHALKIDDILRLEAPPETTDPHRTVILARTRVQWELAEVFAALRGDRTRVVVTRHLDEALATLERPNWRPPTRLASRRTRGAHDVTITRGSDRSWRVEGGTESTSVDFSPERWLDARVEAARRRPANASVWFGDAMSAGLYRRLDVDTGVLLDE